MKASAAVTTGFVVLPILVAAGFVMACGVAVPFSWLGTLLIAGLPIWFLVVASWNILGFVLLVNIETVAIVSTRWLSSRPSR